MQQACIQQVKNDSLLGELKGPDVGEAHVDIYACSKLGQLCYGVCNVLLCIGPVVLVHAGKSTTAV